MVRYTIRGALLRYFECAVIGKDGDWRGQNLEPRSSHVWVCCSRKVGVTNRVWDKRKDDPLDAAKACLCEPLSNMRDSVVQIKISLGQLSSRGNRNSVGVLTLLLLYRVQTSASSSGKLLPLHVVTLV